MKRFSSLLFSVWMVASLFAQSWNSPDVESLQSAYHGKTIIDFKLLVDEVEFSTMTYIPTVAAFIDGECRGESSPAVIYGDDGSPIMEYHTLTVYGDPTADADKVISFRFFDQETMVEYILPKTYTFDSEHHGYPSVLEEISFQRVREISLSNEELYPGGTFDLNNFLTLHGEYTEVYDGTKIVVTWMINDNTLPEGFELDPNTGILTTSENAQEGKVSYEAMAGNYIFAEGTLTLVYSVVQIEMLQKEIQLPVGSNINQYVTKGEYFNVLPAAANQGVTITAEDANIVDARGNVLAKGSTILTIASVENPEIKGMLTLNAYIPLEGFELREGETLYGNYENIYMDRKNKKVLTLYPLPAGARVDTNLIDIYTYSTMDNEGADFTRYKVQVEDIVMEYNESDEFEYATITLHGWSIGREDLNITYGTEENIEHSYWNPVVVGSDFQLVDGWDWVTINDNWFLENNSFNYLNGADYFGGGLIDVRSKTENLYKDPLYGIYGSITYMDNSTCYKMKFDRSQAKLLEENVTSFVTYPQKMEAGANPYAFLSKGWNWLGYPFEFDYEFAELEPYFTQNEGVDGDLILASDNSFVSYSSEAGGWVVPDDGFTFRYGKGYLYYTTSDRHLDFYWGDVYQLEQKDLTVSEPSGAPALNRETTYWEYDIHSFPKKMAIIARLDGIDNPADYTIGAFVGDECRGEGKVAKQWVFITVNGESNEQITFRLIDKRTGICYDLAESLLFDLMAGSLKDPIRFKTGAITGVENMESSSLTIQGHVATAEGAVQVLDVQGKVVAEGYQRVDFSHLNSGVYVVKAGEASRKVIK